MIHYILEMDNIKHLDLYNIIDSEFVFDFKKIKPDTIKETTDLYIINQNTISFYTKSECNDILIALSELYKKEIKVNSFDEKTGVERKFTIIK